MNALIYIRVSTKEQAENLSLSTQLQFCRRCAESKGYDVDETFEDAGESAKSSDRPGLLKLLAYCRENKGRVHAVIVYDLSRFSRNTSDHHALRALLRKFGITLISATQPINEDPEGRLMENVLASFAQYENDAKAKRTKLGMKAALGKGRWAWRAPIGYRIGNRQLGEPSLVKDSERAPHIHLAFQLVANWPLLSS